jgi:hypothetical protein
VHNGSSEPGGEIPGGDAPPYRGDRPNDEPVEGKIVVPKKDRDKISGMIAKAITTAGLGVTLLCDVCGETVGKSADTIAEAATNYICGKPKMVARMLEGGMESLDLFFLVAAVVPVCAEIAHHHIPGRTRRPNPPASASDLLQPDIPWQP